jgi:hypothetical protein
MTGPVDKLSLKGLSGEEFVFRFSQKLPNSPFLSIENNLEKRTEAGIKVRLTGGKSFLEEAQTDHSNSWSTETIGTQSLASIIKLFC